MENIKHSGMSGVSGENRENGAENNIWRKKGWNFPKFIENLLFSRYPRSPAITRQDRYKENHT